MIQQFFLSALPVPLENETLLNCADRRGPVLCCSADQWRSFAEWGHGQPPPPPPPPPPLPEQPWIPPGSAPMDVVTPSEDSNSQDSVDFNSEAHHGVYPQNSHGYGAQPDSYAMAPMAMNQFDYQVCRCYSRKILKLVGFSVRSEYQRKKRSTATGPDPRI